MIIRLFSSLVVVVIGHTTTPKSEKINYNLMEKLGIDLQ